MNGPVLRQGLSKNAMAIYDEAGAMARERWNRIEAELKGGAGGFDRERMADLVYCTLTELMTDGLLRPSEGLPQTGFISQNDVSFERDASGKLKSCNAMITPIKWRGRNVGDLTKKPIMIKARRLLANGGAPRYLEHGGALPSR